MDSLGSFGGLQPPTAEAIAYCTVVNRDFVYEGVAIED